MSRSAPNYDWANGDNIPVYNLSCATFYLHLCDIPPFAGRSSTMTTRRPRAWSTSCCSTTSQSSIALRISQAPEPVEPAEGHTNAYGSFTTTVPAILSLRTHLSLHIPIRPTQRDLDSTPPDSPLSSPSVLGSRRSPSITRTLMTDFEWGGTHAPSPTSPSSLVDDGDIHNKLPVLEAIERGSKLSYRTICSTCMKSGTNFPRCPRCNGMWCSRECRLQGGTKHICDIRRR